MDILSLYLLLLPLLFLLCEFCFAYAKSNLNMLEKKCYKKYAEKIFILIFAITLIVLTGFRSIKLSTDYGNYKSILSQYKKISFTEIPIHNGEWIFAYFYKFCGVLFNYDVVGFMATIAVLTILPICSYFQKESTVPWISAILLLTLGSYWTSFNTVRQYLAAALFIFTYRYIKKRAFVKYLLLVVLIAGIHSTTLLMIPFYWFLNIRWNFRKSKYIFIISAFFFLEFISIIIMRKITIPAFIMKDLAERNSFMNIVRPGLLFCVFLIFYKKVDFTNVNDRFLFNSSFFYMLIYGLTLGMKIFQRFSYFLVFPAVIAIPNMVCRSSRKSKRVVLYAFYILFGLAYSIYTLKMGQPYNFVWND